MMTGFRTSTNQGVAVIAGGCWALLAAAAYLLAAAPAGWVFAGKPQEYDCGIDPKASHNGQFSSYIKSKEGLKPTGFGSVVRDFSAAPYLGKRIRFSANLKSDDVHGWGGLWMRVDDANRPKNGFPASVALDDMHNRSIHGTTAWQNYAIVLDVPEGATGIYIGFLLTGQGELWMNGNKVAIVGSNIPVTAHPLDQPPSLDLKPRNLSFDK
jgi:hypothetical protein